MSEPARARSGRSLALGSAIVAACSWGLWSLFLRPTGLPSGITGPIVFVVMFAAMLPMMRADRAAPSWDRTTLLLLLGLSVTDALNVGAYFASMSVTTLGVAVLSHYMTPLLVAILAPFIDGERIRGARWAVLAATLGLALVLEPWRSEGSRWLGAALGALSAVGYAGNVFLATRLVPRIGAARSVGYHSLISAALLVPFAPVRDWATVTPRSLAMLAISGVTLGALSGWLFSRSLPVIGPTVASTVALLEPLVAVVVGFVAYGERLSWWALLGGAVVLGAGAWVARAPRGASDAPAPTPP